jgi:hypothetical protein
LRKFRLGQLLAKLRRLTTGDGRRIRDRPRAGAQFVDHGRRVIRHRRISWRRPSDGGASGDAIMRFEGFERCEDERSRGADQGARINGSLESGKQDGYNLPYEKKSPCRRQHNPKAKREEWEEVSAATSPAHQAEILERPRIRWRS